MTEEKTDSGLLDFTPVYHRFIGSEGYARKDGLPLQMPEVRWALVEEAEKIQAQGCAVVRLET